jgi:hypothetical protein
MSILLRLINPVLYLLSSTWTHSCYFHHTPVCSKVLLRRSVVEFLEVFSEVLGI